MIRGEQLPTLPLKAVNLSWQGTYISDLKQKRGTGHAISRTDRWRINYVLFSSHGEEHVDRWVKKAKQKYLIQLKKILLSELIPCDPKRI